MFLSQGRQVGSSSDQNIGTPPIRDMGGRAGGGRSEHLAFLLTTIAQGGSPQFQLNTDLAAGEKRERRHSAYDCPLAIKPMSSRAQRPELTIILRTMNKVA